MASAEVPAFTELVDMASDGYGSKVVFATDDWFAESPCMIRRAPPVSRLGTFTEQGQWMDGWESRRKRIPGHDWAIIKLGVPGVIKGVEVNTSFFTGNFPPAMSVQAAYIPSPPKLEGRNPDPECVTPGTVGECPTPEELTEVGKLGSDTWETIVDMQRLRSGVPATARNFFSVESPTVFTHVRLNLFPDGGVARFRVHGEVQRDWQAIASRGTDTDMAAAEHGGQVLGYSDAHYGHPRNLIAPGRGVNMGDGWETARKPNRGPILLTGGGGMIDYGSQCDWAVFKLATRCVLSRVEIATDHFKGNFPESFLLEATDLPGAGADPLAADTAWTPVLPRTRLSAHCTLTFPVEAEGKGPMTHYRITIYPDGGVSRLRLWGMPHQE